MTIFERIQEFNKGLLPAKVARKYTLLIENPFTFFRGTNHLFYEDLSKATMPSSPACWLCGDLHIENFGSYKGDNRLVYFDINDFDDGILAPVAWEIVRVLTSILIAFDALRITDKQAMQCCKIFLQQYCDILALGSPRYIEARTATGIVERFLGAVEKRSDRKLLAKRTYKRSGRLHLSTGRNKQLKIDDALKQELIKVFTQWMESNNAPPNDYKVLDARFRLAGTGSLGVYRYVFLIQKNSDAGKHMLIDMKEARPSSLMPYVKVKQPLWESEAQRVVTVQRIMQNVSAAELSTLNFEDRHYIMHEMQPTKDRINFKIIQDDFKVICQVMEDMATITASAHLRGVGRKGSSNADELIAFAQHADWHKDVLDYALNYKAKAEADFAEFKDAMASRKEEI